MRRRTDCLGIFIESMIFKIADTRKKLEDGSKKTVGFQAIGDEQDERLLV